MSVKNELRRVGAMPLVRKSRGKVISAKGEGILDLVPLKKKFARILVPIDFSETSRKALQYAVPFAEQFGGKISLLHVIPPCAYPGDDGFIHQSIQLILETSERNLKEMAQEMIPNHLLDQVTVCIGQPFHEIVEAARKGADLIVITTHGYTGLKRAWMGSTAERVVRCATCPVLTIHKNQREFV